jgi:dTDP-4-dehydrorhamnose 3,5-epimerase
VTLSDIRVTPLKRISVVGGDVLHAIKCTDEDFRTFGEAYFSMVDHRAVKAWKRHRAMTLNLVVPFGRVRFVFVAEGNPATGPRVEIAGESDYVRLTVPPGIWFGFQGLNQRPSLILNVADTVHDPGEVERRDVDSFAYDWELPE